MIIDWAKQNWKLATGIVVAAVIVGNLLTAWLGK